MKTITFILFSIISVNCFAQQFVAEVNWSYLSCHGNDASACVSVALLGGTPPYSYSWSTGATSVCINGLGGGNYCLTITDANNIKADTCFTILQDSPPLTATHQ